MVVRCLTQFAGVPPYEILVFLTCIYTQISDKGGAQCAPHGFNRAKPINEPRNIGNNSAEVLFVKEIH